MNFKKFISGVSALTIAASAFAGMAVTANAASKTVTKYTLPAAVTGAKGSQNYTPGSTDIDFGTDVSSIKSGVIYIDYQTNITVDLTNTGGNRPGYITLNGLNDADEAITVFDYYSNTSKSNNKARRLQYAIGGRVVDNATPTNFAWSDTTTKTYNFSLKIDLDNNKISGTITGEGSDTAAATIAETDLNVSAITGFNLGSTTSNMQTVNSATVYVKEEVEYSITTAPYAKVTVGDAVTYSNAAGAVDLTDIEVADGQTITVEKTGYATAADTVDLANVANIALTPNAGTYYTEDFSYVTDGTFGFSEGATVSGEALNISTTNTETVTASVPSTSVAGKTIHIVAKASGASANHYGRIALNGAGLKLYAYGSQMRIEGAAKNQTGLYSGTNTYDIAISENGKAATVYVNGAEAKTINTSEAATDLNGISFYREKGTFKATISEISVIDTPATVNVKIGDTKTVYILGSTVTIPAAEEGYEWQDAEGNVVAAGDVVVDADLTLTAVATAVPAANFVVDLGNGTAANGTEDYADAVSTWYIATVTNNGDAEGDFSSMTLTKDGANSTKSFTNVTLGVNAEAYFGIIISGLDTTADTVTATVE